MNEQLDNDNIGENKCTFISGPEKYNVIGETEDYYIVDTKIGKRVIEKREAVVVTISGIVR